MSIRIAQQFLKLESSSAIVLFMMAVISMVLANSPLRGWHQAFIDHSAFIVNDALMTFFFLLVGMELKRGYLEGPLAKRSQVVLPAVAAVGGMVLPALIYLLFNSSDAVTARGWATPVATDIAFAVGVLMLFGQRVPTGLRLFLLALAIFDDVGAILIIAFCYSREWGLAWLSVAGVLTLILYLMNKKGVQSLLAYLCVGVLLWFAVLRTGIHPTIAGVLLALMIPAKSDHSHSPLQQLEQRMHPWVAYLIMPLFALTNAGFTLHGLTANELFGGVVLGIVAGLFIGKQLGVFGLTWLLVRLRWIALPEKTSWGALYGVSVLCGIGFTMSLFLGTLAFSDEMYLVQVRMGVMLGSLLSGVVGAGVLRWVLGGNHDAQK